MLKILAVAIILFGSLFGEELKIKADYFESDEKKGYSLFRGNVHIQKGFDEINASRVTIYTDAQRNPIRYVAEGNVHFKIEDKNKKKYTGTAQKVIYDPIKKEYRFYTDVYLKQIDGTKVIRGDEVVFDALRAKAYAKGVKNNPVIMIFNIEEEKE